MRTGGLAVKFATIKDAATALGVTESRMRRAVQMGMVPSMKLGSRSVVDIDAAAEVLKSAKGVSIEEVSRETGLNISAIRRGIREGWIPCEKPGKAYVFQMDAVREAINARVREQTQRNKQ